MNKIFKGFITESDIDSIRSCSYPPSITLEDVENPEVLNGIVRYLRVKSAKNPQAYENVKYRFILSVDKHSWHWFYSHMRKAAYLSFENGYYPKLPDHITHLSIFRADMSKLQITHLNLRYLNIGITCKNINVVGLDGNNLAIHLPRVPSGLYELLENAPRVLTHEVEVIEAMMGHRLKSLRFTGKVTPYVLEVLDQIDVASIELFRDFCKVKPRGKKYRII